MRNFLILMAFVVSLAGGVMLSSAANIDFIVNEITHRDCIRRGEEPPHKTFFTLEEATILMGKKVVSKNPDFRYGEKGRIISFEMIGTDKFLIEIYWGKGAEDENSSVTFHGKELFSEDFETVD